jgi:hypothetical protein
MEDADPCLDLELLGYCTKDSDSNLENTITDVRCEMEGMYVLE